MHALTITYGPTATQDTMYFKTRAAAIEARDAFGFGGADACVEDDYGNQLSVFGEVHSMRVFEIEAALDAAAEQHLASMRAQAKAQQKANSDPMLRLVGSAGVLAGVPRMQQ